MMDGWPWNCEGGLKAKGCVAAQCLGVNLKKQ